MVVGDNQERRSATCPCSDHGAGRSIYIAGEGNLRGEGPQPTAMPPVDGWWGQEQAAESLRCRPGGDSGEGRASSVLEAAASVL